MKHEFTYLGRWDGEVGVGLNLHCASFPELIAAGQTAALQVHNEIGAAIETQRAVVTPLAKEAARRRDDLAAAQERLAVLEGRPSVLHEELEAAMEAGNNKRADEIERELAGMGGQIEAAKRRVDVAARLAREADALRDREQVDIETGLRLKRQAEIRQQLDKARAELNAAIGKAFPHVLLLEHKLAGVDAGWKPPPERPWHRELTPEELKRRQEAEEERQRRDMYEFRVAQFRQQQPGAYAVSMMRGF